MTSNDLGFGANIALHGLAKMADVKITFLKI